MNANEQNHLPGTLQDVCCAVRRHKLLVLCFFAFVMLAVVLANALLPATYRSESKLFLRLGRENVILDSTATMTEKPIIVAPASREDELNSVVENLASRQLVEKVVDAIGPATILEQSSKETADTDSPESLKEVVQNSFAGLAGFARRLLGNAVGTPRDMAILQLEKRLEVSPVRKSNVVTVAYEAGDPTQARDVLAKLVDFYLEEHVRLNRPAGANKFFAEQAAQTRVTLTRMEEELLTLKQKTDMASPREREKQLVAQRGQLETDHLTAARELAATEARVKALEEQLKTLPESQIAAELTGQGDEGTNRMRDRFYALQVAENDAAAVYTPDHPKWIRLHDQVEAAKKTLDQEPRTTRQVTTTANRAYQDVHLALLHELASLRSTRARVESLDRQLAGLRQKAKMFERDSLRLARLEREVEMLEGSYRQYAMNLEKTRVDEALEASRISNICVAEPATYNVKPVRPHRLANLACGLLIGLCGGIGLALLRERLDRSIRSMHDIEATLNVPALASIPRLRRGQFQINIRN